MKDNFGSLTFLVLDLQLNSIGCIQAHEQGTQYHRQFYLELRDAKITKLCDGTKRANLERNHGFMCHANPFSQHRALLQGC